jgi:hypothetical protein
MVGLIVVGVLVVAAVVAWKLHASGKAVTGSAVVAGVEADVAKAANTAKADVANTVSKVL